MSEWLSPDDVEALTDRKRWGAQCRALARMGVNFRPNAAGRPLVERAAVLSVRDKVVKKVVEPDWTEVKRSAA